MKIGDLVTVRSMYTFNKMNTVIGGVNENNWKLNMGIIMTVFETDDKRQFEKLMLCNHLQILSEG